MRPREHLQRARELVYKSLDAAEVVEVRRAALMTEGRPLIPAVLIAMTNGDFAAVDVSKLRPSAFDGTSKPMMMTPPM